MAKGLTVEVAHFSPVSASECVTCHLFALFIENHAFKNYDYFF